MSKTVFASGIDEAIIIMCLRQMHAEVWTMDLRLDLPPAVWMFTTFLNAKESSKRDMYVRRFDVFLSQ